LKKRAKKERMEAVARRVARGAIVAELAFGR